MTFKAGDVVDVFDPDENQWYAGVVDSIDWIAGHLYYAVALDRKQQLSERSFTQVKVGDDLPKLSLLAVPFNRPQWIRNPR